MKLVPELPPSDEEALTPDLRGTIVLLVDSDAGMLQSLQGMLEHFGAICRSTTTGEEALALLTSERVDVLVSDAAMALADGNDLVGQVRGELRSSVPAIALIAGAAAPSARGALDAGYDDSVSKPIDATELGWVVEKFAPRHL